MAISRKRIRSVKLVKPEDMQKMIDQRRTFSRHMDDYFRRQCTGAFHRYVSGIHEAYTNNLVRVIHSHDPNDIALQPTQQMRATGPIPKVTDKLAQYHEPHSDEIDIRALRIPSHLDTLIETYTYQHARIPDVIRLNPVVVQLLKCMNCCEVRKSGRGEITLYRGEILLMPDPEVDANHAGIDYL